MYEEAIKKRFLAREDISQINKKYVKDFFKGYNCSKSSEGKFYSWLPYVLSKCKDINKTMHNESQLVDIFDKLHKKLKPSGYKTVSDVTRTFCRRLNKGELPDTFKMIKQLTKQEKTQLKRINKAGYTTFTWGDGLKICDQTTSTQLKAMVLVQLDGGLRPGELEVLNYADVKRDGKFIYLHIRQSKTAQPRNVVLYRSAPALNRWLQQHPLKKDDSPLWLMEHKEMSNRHSQGDNNIRYNYHAIRQTIRRMAAKAGFKGASLYMMRHSAVSLAKQEMMGIDIAAEKFGHDINYYVNTYGKLTDEQKINRFKSHYGEVKNEKDKQPKPLLCSVCDTINDPDKEFCEKCNSPLTLTLALSIDKKREDEVSQLRADFNKLARQLSKIIPSAKLEKLIKLKKLKEAAK